MLHDDEEPGFWTKSLSNPNDDKEPGFFTKSLSNPWLGGAYALGTGLLAGATPGTARLAGGLNYGLRTVLGAEAQEAKKRQKQRLSDALGKFADSSTETRTTKMSDVSPATAAFSIGDEDDSRPYAQRLNEVLSYEDVENKPNFNPQQREYLKLLGAEDPKAGLSAIGSTLFKEPAAPDIFGGTEPGYYARDRSGKVTPLVPGQPKPPPHPISSTQGGEATDQVYDAATNSWVTNRRPLLPAPIAPERAADMSENRRLQEEAIEQRREAARDAAFARSQAARERREMLQDRRDDRAQQQTSQSERDRAMKPEDIRMAEVAITKSALDRGVDKMPARARAAALKQIARDYGFELEGSPTLERAGWLTGENALRGEFSLRPRPLTTKTERSRGPNTPQPDPRSTPPGRAPQRLKFDAQGNLIP